MAGAASLVAGATATGWEELVLGNRHGDVQRKGENSMMGKG
jgi:hypothetical protein